MIDDDFEFIAKKLGIKNEELESYFKMPKKFYWDYKNQNSIFKLGAKVLRLIGGETVKKRKK